MSNRIFNLICGICVLVTGGILYVLFREHTLVATLLSSMPFVACLRSVMTPFSNEFICYYIPDFLWAFSLGCLLKSVPGFSNKSMLCGMIAFNSGIVWELLQFAGFVRGTFDWIDILMYLLAGILCQFIKIKEKEK